MDISSTQDLAATAVTIMAPFMPYLVNTAKAAGEIFVKAIAEQGGEAAWEKAKELWGKITSRHGDDQLLAGAAIMVSAKPDDIVLQGQLASCLVEQLEADKFLTQELMTMLGGSLSTQQILAEQGSHVMLVKQKMRGMGQQLTQASDGSSISGVVQEIES